MLQSHHLPDGVSALNPEPLHKLGFEAVDVKNEKTNESNHCDTLKIFFFFYIKIQVSVILKKN